MNNLISRALTTVNEFEGASTIIEKNCVNPNESDMIGENLYVEYTWGICEVYVKNTYV